MNLKENIVNDKDKTKDVTSKSILLAGLVYLLLSVYLPVAFFININTSVLQIISIAAAVACAFAISRLSGAKKPSASIFLVIACFIFLGTVLCGLVAAVIGSVCILGYLLMSAKNTAAKALSFLPAIAAYIIAYLVIGSPIAAAIALAHIPAAIALAYSFKNRLGRVSSICRISIGIILGLTAILSAFFISRHGLSLEALISMINSAKNSLMTTLANGLFSVSGELFQMSRTDTEELSATVISAAFNLLPAIIVVLSNILAFFLHLTMTRIMLRSVQSKEDVKTMVSFEMSLISAIVFLCTLLLAAILSEEITVWSVTVENLMFILMPGLIFTAVGTLRAFMFAKGSSCFGALAYLAIIMSIFYLPSVMLPVGSIAGAVIIIIHNVAKGKAEKKDQ